MQLFAIGAALTVLLTVAIRPGSAQDNAVQKPACCAGDPPSATGDVYRPDQHSYRFALLKKWFERGPGVPIYAGDNHPDVPMNSKLLRYCAPAVPPEDLYATPKERW
jgi:hypothetical protein